MEHLTLVGQQNPPIFPAMTPPAALSYPNGTSWSNQPDKKSQFSGDVHCEEYDEPLLKESHRRFVLFPIQYEEVWSLVALHIVIDLLRRFGPCTRKVRSPCIITHRVLSPLSS